MTEQDRLEEAAWSRERLAMMNGLELSGIRDGRVLAAMGRVRRHRFIPDDYRCHGTAYADHAGPIGLGQTISQPYIVAYMIEALGLKPGETVLEIGTGSGYQAAVLAEMGQTVYTVEILSELSRPAKAVLAAEGYGERVHVRTADGSEGWPERAPFDTVIGACAAPELPAFLRDQLKEGGRFIFPVGEAFMMQRLVFGKKRKGHLEMSDDLPVAFVPLVKG